MRKNCQETWEVWNSLRVMVTTVSSAKTDEPIEVRLGRKTHVGPKITCYIGAFWRIRWVNLRGGGGHASCSCHYCSNMFFPKCLPQCRTALSRISKQCFASKFAFGALTLLVGCQGEHLACKIEWWGVGVVICLERGADCLHIVQLMLLHRKPHHLLPHLNSDWFYFSGTGLPRLSWKRGRQTDVGLVVVLVVSNVFGSTSSRGWPSNSIAALSTEHWAAAAAAAAAAAVVVSSLGRSARACVRRPCADD